MLVCLCRLTAFGTVCSFEQIQRKWVCGERPNTLEREAGSERNAWIRPNLAETVVSRELSVPGQWIVRYDNVCICVCMCVIDVCGRSLSPTNYLRIYYLHVEYHPCVLRFLGVRPKRKRRLERKILHKGGQSLAGSTDASRSKFLLTNDPYENKDTRDKVKPRRLLCKQR
jgi:hypothetical protein